MDINKKIGSELKKEREKAGISRRSLAKKLNVSDVAIYYWEFGINSISLESFIKYCNVIGIDYIKLLKRILEV